MSTCYVCLFVVFLLVVSLRYKLQLAYAYSNSYYIVIGNRYRLSIIVIMLLFCCGDVNEQIPIEMLAKRPAHKVESDRIGTAVGKGHAKADDAKDMPEHVVILLCCGPVNGIESMYVCEFVCKPNGDISQRQVGN